jgi:beta-galactosidase
MTGPTRRDALLGGAGALLVAGAAVAAPPAVAAPAARQRVRLSDGWRFHLGHAADVDRDFGYGSDQRTLAKAGVTSPATLPGFDDSNWRAVRVPHDWATDLPYAPPAAPAPAGRADDIAAHGFKAIGRAFPENSVGWYRIALPIAAADAGRRIRLEFDGVFRDARVFVNGYDVARNESGYAPFGIDITDFVDWSGPNQLAVRVDASFGEGWFYEGAGIYRHVDLVKTAPVHVPQWGVFVRSEVDGEGATARVQAEVSAAGDAAAAVSLRHRLVDAAGRIVVETSVAPFAIEAGGTVIREASVRIAAPRLWSLDDPHLYRCVTDVVVDGAAVDIVETPFGIRTIRFDARTGFTLNGRPVKLLGTCNHQDHAGVGTAIPDRLHAWRLEQLQSMGSNAWRSAHNPPSQSFLDICDAKGMLVIDEARLNSTGAEATDELTRMVRRDRNHPCVILWSVGNEEPQQGTPRGALISAGMRRHILSLDPTRPITQAFDKAFDTGASRVVDVMGFNYRTDQIPAWHERFPDQPVICTEAGSTVSTRGAYANDPARHVVRAYDTEYPYWAATAEQWWSIADAHPYIAGGFVWTGFDYRGEPTPHPSWPSVSSYFGALDLCGFPKDEYWYYRAWWRREAPFVHLLPHWTWPGREGEPIEVWAYSACEEVELLLSGRSVGRRPMPRDGHAMWRVPYAAGRLEAIGLVGGRRVAHARVETAGQAAAIRIEPDRRRIMADGDDLAVVRLAIVDAAGRIVPDAAHRVRLRVTGSGRLIGAGNGDPTCHAPDHGEEWPAFHGLLQALVQSDGRRGATTITAIAAGLGTGQATLLAI